MKRIRIVDIGQRRFEVEGSTFCSLFWTLIYRANCREDAESFVDSYLENYKAYRDRKVIREELY